MLAQNFKTAADLGIKERQHAALRLTLNALEREELKHAPAAIFHDPTSPFTGHFNMNCWHASSQCGTVCCIGGTAELLGGLKVNSLTITASGNSALHRLFYPLGHKGWDRITPSQAASALRSFLTTGDANWAEALA